MHYRIYFSHNCARRTCLTTSCAFKWRLFRCYENWTYVERLKDELFEAVGAGDGALVALVLHVVVQVAVLDARSALVLAPDDLQRTVALVCLPDNKQDHTVSSISQAWAARVADSHMIALHVEWKRSQCSMLHTEQLNVVFLVQKVCFSMWVIITTMKVQFLG